MMARLVSSWWQDQVHHEKQYTVVRILLVTNNFAECSSKRKDIRRNGNPCLSTQKLRTHPVGVPRAMARRWLLDRRKVGHLGSEECSQQSECSLPSGFRLHAELGTFCYLSENGRDISSSAVVSLFKTNFVQGSKHFPWALLRQIHRNSSKYRSHAVFATPWDRNDCERGLFTGMITSGEFPFQSEFSLSVEKGTRMSPHSSVAKMVHFVKILLCRWLLSSWSLLPSLQRTSWCRGN